MNIHLHLRGINLLHLWQSQMDLVTIRCSVCCLHWVSFEINSIQCLDATQLLCQFGKAFILKLVVVCLYHTSLALDPSLIQCSLTQKSSNCVRWDMFSMCFILLFATSSVFNLSYHKQFRSSSVMHLSPIYLPLLTLFSRPSIFSMALCDKYNSCRLCNSSNPSNLVIRLLWILKICKLRNGLRFYTHD